MNGICEGGNKQSGFINGLSLSSSSDTSINSENRI